MVDDLTHKAPKKQRNPPMNRNVPDLTPENPKENFLKLLQGQRRMTNQWNLK